MTREDNAHCHQHNHHGRSKEKKGSPSSSHNAKHVIAKDTVVKEDAESALQAIPKLSNFLVNLGKLFLIFLLEPFVVVYVICSKISFDQVLTYAGYILLIAFLVIPLQIFTFFVTLPVKIGLVMLSSVSNILNMYKNFWLFILYGLRFKVLEFETNIKKLETVNKNNAAPSQETLNLDAKLEKCILSVFQLFLTADQMRIIQAALTGKEIASDDSKASAAVNGK